MSNWGRWNPCACWWKSWADWVCLWPPSTDNKQGLPFILSVCVILSSACLSVSDRHTATQKQALAQRITAHNPFINSSLLYRISLSTALRKDCEHFSHTFKLICIFEIYYSHINTVTDLWWWKPLHGSLTQVYFGLMKLNGGSLGYVAQSIQMAVSLCEQGHRGTAAHSTALTHLYLCHPNSRLFIRVQKQLYYRSCL